jgi:DNA-binding XRE family transcriptional regulator
MIRKRWNSKLARFIMSYGVARLATKLGIRASAIYHWTAGRCSPDLVNALAIQKLARRRRVTISLVDIFRQRRETHCKRGIKLTLGPDVSGTRKSPKRTVAKVVQFPLQPLAGTPGSAQSSMTE